MKIKIEIRAAEGGNDSKLLVEDQLNIYTRTIRNNGFEHKILEQNPGFVSL